VQPQVYQTFRAGGISGEEAVDEIIYKIFYG